MREVEVSATLGTEPGVCRILYRTCLHQHVAVGSSPSPLDLEADPRVGFTPAACRELMKGPNSASPKDCMASGVAVI